MTARTPSEDIRGHRLRAARRRAVGLRLRRLVPSLVVGTSTLAGTGGLVAWVSHQPGMQVTTTGSSAPAGAPAATGRPDDTAALAGVQKQLHAEEAALQALQDQLARLRRTQATEAGRAGTAGTAPGAAGGPAFPSLSPMPTIPPLPALPAPMVVPSPATNATTGASHALP